MSKRRYGLSEEKIQAYIKEGRGQGEGENYKPWISIHDFPSQGRVSRCFSWKTGRVHHFMSDLETRYFYLLEWSDVVVDVREQYPLLDREKVQKTAQEKGIRYPEDPTTKTPVVLTTDFLITIKQDGTMLQVARTIKSSRDLDKPRTIEKFELERAYWEEQGIDWGIVTEHEINREFASNIEWVHDAYKLESIGGIDTTMLTKCISILKERLCGNSSHTVQHVLHDVDKEFNYESGLSLYLLRHLIATKQITICHMNKKININQPIEKLLTINPEMTVKEKRAQ